MSDKTMILVVVISVLVIALLGTIGYGIDAVRNHRAAQPQTPDSGYGIHGCQVGNCDGFATVMIKALHLRVCTRCAEEISSVLGLPESSVPASPLPPAGAGTESPLTPFLKSIGGVRS